MSWAGLVRCTLRAIREAPRKDLVRDLRAEMTGLSPFTLATIARNARHAMTWSGHVHQVSAALVLASHRQIDRPSVPITN